MSSTVWKPYDRCMPDDDLDDIFRTTGMLFSAIDAAKAEFARIAAEHGLTPQLARAVLWLDEPAPMRALADHLQCDASTVTHAADRLQSLGLADRQPGPDRRTKLLALSSQGHRLRRRLSADVARHAAVARLSAAQRRELRELLTLLRGDAA